MKFLDVSGGRSTDRQSFALASALLAVLASVAAMLFAVTPADAGTIRVLKTGLGDGSVQSVPLGISCGGDCDQIYPVPEGVSQLITLSATAAAGSSFVRWEGACTHNAPTCILDAAARVQLAVVAVFELDTPIVPLTDAQLDPGPLETYLANNSHVNPQELDLVESRKAKSAALRAGAKGRRWRPRAVRAVRGPQPPGESPSVEDILGRDCGAEP